MWTLLSFTGRFDCDFFASLQPKPIRGPGESTDEQKAKNKEATEARSKYRLANKYARLRHRIRSGRAQEGERLGTKQLELLSLLDDGTLLAEANRLTRLSGHGRLRRSDRYFVDLGGSTGGYVRVVLNDWAPPDLEDFLKVPPIQPRSGCRGHAQAVRSSTFSAH